MVSGKALGLGKTFKLLSCALALRHFLSSVTDLLGKCIYIPGDIRADDESAFPRAAE